MQNLLRSFRLKLTLLHCCCTTVAFVSNIILYAFFFWKCMSLMMHCSDKLLFLLKIQKDENKLRGIHVISQCFCCYFPSFSPLLLWMTSFLCLIFYCFYIWSLLKFLFNRLSQFWKGTTFCFISFLFVWSENIILISIICKNAATV